LSHSFTEKGQRKKIKMIMTNFAQRLKSVNFFQTTKFSNIDINFSNISLMFVQTFRSYFSEEIFYRLCLNSSVMQVGVFPKAKTGKHKGEIKTHQRRKNWKAKKSKQQKQKTNIHRRCI
jgi:hypothetical protein